MQVKELISYIASSLVDSPQDVEVLQKEKEKDVVFCLKVKKDDLGKVIGKKGRTAKAIRTFVYALGAKENKKFYLDIVEPEKDKTGQDQQDQNEAASK